MCQIFKDFASIFVDPYLWCHSIVFPELPGTIKCFKIVIDSVYTLGVNSGDIQVSYESGSSCKNSKMG